MITNCNIKRHKVIKLVLICTILTLLSYVFLSTVNEEIYATQTRENYSEAKLSVYPGYKELIGKLKSDHPSWNFTIFYTGLDWNQVIKNETTAYHGRNVVPASWPSAWRCASCGDTPRAGNSWRCASEAAVAYYMDPRNWMNDSYIFEFENLAFNPATQNIEGVQRIISDIGYMQEDYVTFTTTDGTMAALPKNYAQIIMEAAEESGISPYHLASRIRQEQGTGWTPGTLATGTCSGYRGYYNFLNIKASGSTNSEIIRNGMNYARNSSWTNPEISIKEGAKILAKNYINDGQDTLYLQKFDVDSSDGTLYYFQYMQNVAAATSESTKVRTAYENIGVLDSSFEFIIPVYENMPEIASEEPRDLHVVTENVRVTGNNVAIRDGGSQDSNIIATVNANDIILRIEVASSKVDNYYWDKVVLANGQKGYIARDYITQIGDVVNCNDSVVANTAVNLRNGPGISGTSIITTLAKGQLLTRIETGMYNLDGYIWDRVKLADGRQGYIAQNYIEGSGSNTGTIVAEIIRIICPSGLKVRSGPGTNYDVVTYADNSETVTRIEAAASNANGYVWDKIVTTSGIEGYIARGTATEQYIEVIEQQAPAEPTPQEPEQTEQITGNNEFKLENENLICEPNTTVEQIKEKNPETTISVKKADGTEVTTGNIGTGYSVIIGENTYTVIKLGDTNGDGKITPADSTVILRAYVGLSNLTDAQTIATDVNKDGKITPADSTVILRKYVGLININIGG